MSEWIEGEDELVPQDWPTYHTEVPVWVLLSGVRSQAYKAYAFLAEHINNRTPGKRIACPKQAAIARVLGLRRPQQVTPYLNELAKIGAIGIEEYRYQGGMRRGYRYRVRFNPPPGYAGHLTLKQFYEANEDVRGAKAPGRTAASGAHGGTKNVTSGGRKNVTSHGAKDVTAHGAKNVSPELNQVNSDQEELLGGGVAGVGETVTTPGAASPAPDGFPPPDGACQRASEDDARLRRQLALEAQMREAHEAAERERAQEAPQRPRVVHNGHTWALDGQDTPARPQKGLQGHSGGRGGGGVQPHQLPDDFTLTDAMRRWALQTFGPGLDIDHQTELFISHHRADGGRRRSWPDEWQKWIRRSAKWAAERGARGPVPAVPGQSVVPSGASGRVSRQQQETNDWLSRAMARAIAKDEQGVS